VGVDPLEENMMKILGELARRLSKLGVRVHECGVGYPKDINAIVVTPLVTHDGEDTTNPSFSYHWIEQTRRRKETQEMKMYQKDGGASKPELRGQNYTH